MNPRIQGSSDWRSFKEKIELVLSQQAATVEAMNKVNQMFTDMYIGDGKENPPWMARMIEVEKSTERYAKDSAQIKALLLGIFASLVTNLIVFLFKK